MKKSHLLRAVCAVVFTIMSLSSHAALVGRDLDGNLTTAEAYYDTVAGLTWLANANAGGDGNWATANAWAAGLDINGVTGWRLPTTLQPDSSCAVQRRGDSYGYACTGSEMGNLFHNVLGNSAGSLISNTGPFSNVQSNYYWSSTEYAPGSIFAWLFTFGNGSQNNYSKTGTYTYAWAVQSGDVGAAVVPVPAAVWLFGSGLIGLISISRRKKSV